MQVTYGHILWYPTRKHCITSKYIMPINFNSLKKLYTAIKETMFSTVWLKLFKEKILIDTNTKSLQKEVSKNIY